MYHFIEFNQAKSYYPCINLSTSITSDGHKQKIFKHILARLNGDAEHNIDADEDYLTTFTFSFVNASEDEIHDAGADDIQCREFLTIGSGLEFAYLRHKNGKVIPVLMITGANTLVDGNSRQIRDQVSNKALIGLMETTLVPAATPEGGEEVPEHIDVTFKDPINLFNKNTGETLNGVWITNPGDYKRVFPRIKIKSRYLKVSQDNLKIRPRGATEALKENYDYYLLPDGDSYYITLKPEDFFKYSTSIFKNGKSYDISYTISNTALAVYLDAVKVLKESAYPKVSYQIDPSIVNENFFYNAYNRLNQLAHINDYELKFENVMGYISEIDLDLDKPWEDKVTVKNYKSKFEDLFSTIVAETEQMKKNAYVTDLVTSAISNKGELTPEVFAKALTSAEVSIPMMRVFSDNQLLLASQMSASAAANMASLANTTAFRVMTGETGLAFKSSYIEDVQLNKRYGLTIQGKVARNETTEDVFFRVTNNEMGFFKGLYTNDGVQGRDEPEYADQQWEPLLYFENGDLALSGNIYAKNGWFGGERGWIIGEGSIANNDYTIGSQTIHDFGGSLYSYNGQVIISTGNENSQKYNDRLPHIVLYRGGFIRNSSGEITGLSNDPVFLFDGENLSITGNVTASSGSVGGWIINDNALWSPVYSKPVNGTTTYFRHRISSNSSDSVSLFLGAPCNENGGNVQVSDASFYVTKEGILHATDAVIAGSITATSGSFGNGVNNISIGTSTVNNVKYGNIHSGSKTGQISSNEGFYLGTDGLALGTTTTVNGITVSKFQVNTDGTLYASNANITGTINARSGQIGNPNTAYWTISGASLYAERGFREEEQNLIASTSLTPEWLWFNREYPNSFSQYSSTRVQLNQDGFFIYASPRNASAMSTIFSLSPEWESKSLFIALRAFNKIVLTCDGINGAYLYGNIHNMENRDLYVKSENGNLYLEGNSIKIKIGNNTVKELEIDSNGFVKAVKEG